MKLANLQKNFRTFVKYELYATGFPTKSTYSLLKVQISGKVLKHDGITIASDGRAIYAGRKGTCSVSEPNSPIDRAFFAGKAEPIRLALVSNDDPHVKGLIQAIPFPNSTTDKGCTLESIIGTPKERIDIYPRQRLRAGRRDNNGLRELWREDSQRLESGSGWCLFRGGSAQCSREDIRHHHLVGKGKELPFDTHRLVGHLSA